MMSWKWIAFLVGFFIGFSLVQCAKAGEVESRQFSSTTDAAMEGLRQSLAASPLRNEEWGGLIVELPGHLFAITKPVTNHKIMAVELHGERPTVEGHKVVGDFHTHVCAHNPKTGSRILSEKFSPADIAQNNAYHQFGYILDECMGTVYVYDWREGKDPEDGPQMGHAVGWLREVAE